MKNRILTLAFAFTSLLAVLNSCSSDSDEAVEEVQENLVSNDNDLVDNEEVEEVTETTAQENEENETTEEVTGTDAVNEDTVPEETEATPEDNGAPVPLTTNTTGNTPIIIEEGGRARFEAEVGVFGDAWELRTDRDNFMGEGYLYWNGNNFFGQPGNGVITYTIRIQNPGTYGIEFRQIIAFGRNNNEYNDIWLRFPDADNFFGRNPKNKDAAIPPIVFPRGGGSSGPFPEGANTRGWFKIFAKSFSFAFRTVTGDNQGFEVFATFDEPGDYTLELSARSMGYGIDQVILFREGTGTGGLNNTFLSPVILE